MNAIPSPDALSQAGLALDALAWQRAADAAARVSLVNAAIDRAAGHEALTSPQLNPWSRVRTGVAAKRQALLRAVDSAAGSVDASFAVAWYQERSAPTQPQFVRCLRGLITANGDPPSAANASGSTNLALLWVVDPTDPALAGVSWDSLEPRATQALRAESAGLPANLAHSLAEGSQDGRIYPVRVREIGDGFDEGVDVPNGELLLGRHGAEFAMGVEARVRLQALNGNAPLVRVVEPGRSLWRLILKLVLGALPVFFISTLAVMATWGLHSESGDRGLVELILWAFAAVSLGAVSYALWRWWRRQFAVARWISRWRARVKWRALPLARAANAMATRGADSASGSTRSSRTSPTRLRGWRLALKRLAYPITALHLLTVAGVVEPLTGIPACTVIVQVAALPLWLIFCRRELRHWWWLSTGAAALMFASTF